MLMVLYFSEISQNLSALNSPVLNPKLNPNNINTKFYGAGVYLINGQLIFLGGKIGLGDEESDYKTAIYRFKFDNMEFYNTEMCYNGKIIFIENEFHYVSKESIGNFINVDDGILATMPISSLLEQVN